MNRHSVYIMIFLATLLVSVASCERDFTIALKTGEPQLIVEAYINNEMPLYNYVILSRSQSYFDTGFQNIPVRGAQVTITEGALLANNTYQWDRSSTRELKEADIPQVPGGAVPGIYIDPLAVSDPSHALQGTPGKHYLLEIETEGGRYSAVTALLQPVRLDSITSGNYFKDSIFTKARLTLYYQDPDTIGNTQLYYWRNNNARNNFAWGGLGTNRFVPGTDDLTNNQYMRLTLNNGFDIGDTVQYHLVSVERKVYNFWDSFNKARDNNGPFATPVRLQSTIQGNNVTGCFSGFSLSTKSIFVK
jgi:hypothetical protein